MQLDRTTPAAAAAAGNGEAVFGQQQQHSLQPKTQRQQVQQESEGAASLRSWLEPRRWAGVAASVAGGVAVVQQQPSLVDEGKGVLDLRT